jgi:hypothetical protein
VDVIYDGLDGALTAEQISLHSRNFSPSCALVRIAAEVPAETSVLVDASGERRSLEQYDYNRARRKMCVEGPEGVRNDALTVLLLEEGARMGCLGA